MDQCDAAEEAGAIGAAGGGEDGGLLFLAACQGSRRYGKVLLVVTTIGVGS